MQTLSTFQGKRVDEPANGLCQPGEYWKDTDGTWRCCTPNGLHGWLKNHHVEELEDGTIDVVAGEWGSNSILVSNGTGNKSWHGCIKRGVWKEF